MNKLGYLSALLLTMLAMPLASFAHCDGVKHSGNHPHCGGEEPPPPPVDCTDEFPDFAYAVEATRKSPGSVYLASTDGCRTEFVKEGVGATMHLTVDRSEGVLVWSEDPDDTNQYTIYRQNFTVAADGSLTVEPRVRLLQMDEEIIPVEDELYYQSIDIWGDADHSSLYMAIWRQHVDNSPPAVSIRELLIYNLNEMTDVREIFRTVQGEGDSKCPDIEYPQFVATCYGRGSAKFNPSGTRLYLGDNLNDKQGQRWDGLVRLDIDRVNFETGGELPLNDWILSARELIWTGPDSQHGGVVPRPDYDPSQLPLQEEIAIWYDRDPSWKRDRIGAILNADQCAADYASYASDISQTPPDLWLGCLTGETFSAPANHGGGDSWQSHEALLTSNLGSRSYSIYRRDISAGTAELLIENARGADTGY